MRTKDIYIVVCGHTYIIMRTHIAVCGHIQCYADTYIVV
jgi:hypothetical protein